jgi:hypothetical protein
LAHSIAQAALEVRPDKDAAEILGVETARKAAAGFDARSVKVVETDELRRVVAQIFRDSGRADVAERYILFARNASELLWKMSVSETHASGADAANETTSGRPWDRRRLVESLRAAGIAADPAGEAARAVERQLVALNRRLVSPALIHALTVLTLQDLRLDQRAYSARRVGVPVTQKSGVETAAPTLFANATRAYWLQTVHSAAITAAIQANQISLAPWPPIPVVHEAAAAPVGEPIVFCDLRRAEMELRDEPRSAAVLLPADNSADRLAVARRLTSPRAAAPGTGGCEVWLRKPAEALRAETESRRNRVEWAPTVTLNLCALMGRERAASSASVFERAALGVTPAVRALREREEHWGLSPVRGRNLPVALAGLWQAAALLTERVFEADRSSPKTAETALVACEHLAAAIAAAREATDLRLVLSADVPQEAALELRNADLAHFAKDGCPAVTPAFAPETYGIGTSLSGDENRSTVEVLLRFLNRAGGLFELPPALLLKVPLGEESSADLWHDLLSAAADAGLTRLKFERGGSRAGLRKFIRQLASSARSLFD